MEDGLLCLSKIPRLSFFIDVLTISQVSKKKFQGGLERLAFMKMMFQKKLLSLEMAIMHILSHPLVYLTPLLLFSFEVIQETYPKRLLCI